MKLNLFQNCLLISSIFIVIFLLIILKWLFKKVKGPNGQRNKFLSLDIALTFCIFTIISLLTLDPLIIFLSAIPTFLIMKNKLDSNSNWYYQLILSMFIGMFVPLIIYWFYILNHNKLDTIINTNNETNETNQTNHNKDTNDFRSIGRNKSPELSLIDLEEPENTD